MQRRIEFGPGQPPYYRQLAAILRHAIATGRYRPGELLPTELVLAHEYEIGFDTVRKSIAILRNEGLIETKRGKGSRVRPTQQVTVTRVGRDALIGSRMPTEEEQQDFGIPDGVPLLVIRTGDHEQLLRSDQNVVGYGDDA